MFKKTLPFLLFSSFMVGILLLWELGGISLGLSYFRPLSLSVEDFGFWFSLDFESLSFLLMVSLVTSLVVLFSELYLDHYNNKKFFFLTLFFFTSMAILVSSGSFLNLLIGWDGLGVSSLCLIMFYPNKVTMFNSFLTFFFNRLGDVALMLIAAIFISSPCSVFFLWENFNSFFLLALILGCSFTKSAQFPLSSWLPAAMSAPTPISAMVHSSTLVTAGIFILLKVFFFLNFGGLTIFLTFFCACTFLTGGGLANLESDLKKIVAFSTMSQISMIILFLSLGFLMIGISHMFAHALFKTLLFMTCGLLFIWNFSDQLKISPSLPSSNSSFYSLLFVSVFSMSGLIFSAAFFTKDCILEELMGLQFLVLFSILLSGSVLTIFYSCEIFSNLFLLNMGTVKKKVSMSKNYFFSFLGLFFFFTLLSEKIFVEILYADCTPVLGVAETLVLILIILMPMFFSIPKNLILKIQHLSAELNYSKFFSFSLFSKLIILDHYSFLFSDQFLFKPNINSSIKFLSIKNSMNSVVFSLVLGFLIFLV